MRSSKKLVASPKEAELEFPDWTEMDDSAARLSLEAAFKLPELYRSWFPGAIKDSSWLDREKCEVEFVL